ncbi:MAG TPA: alkaline phosphatase family protein [Usitatibacter sp.]|jgi:phospholipase C|nr:alkaline phosphatase family protein [Usitatibacter sp.]
MKRIALLLVALVVAGCAATQPAAVANEGLGKIEHVVVLFQENWSFDGLFGKFPGANGLAQAKDALPQSDKQGHVYAVLPPAIGPDKKPDPRIPTNLPNAPFDLAQYVPPDEKAGNPIHQFYQNQLQIDGGRNDRFVAWTNVGALVMSYYDASDFPLGRLAKRYTLADNFFMGAFGGSFLNHIWLACACTPEWKDAPQSLRAVLDEHGMLVKDGAVTPDGYVVNTSYTVNTPHPARIKDPTHLMPNQSHVTLGDRLSAKGISWAWYSGGWADAIAGHPHPVFQYHHQPYAYFANYADGTAAKKEHLLDEQAFIDAVETGTLRAVSFVKPLGPLNEHPGYADVMSGQKHIMRLVDAIMASPQWKSTVIIITYDENGGRWDHVAPPVVDRWGPGTRIPAVIVSPYAKRGYVDHTQYDTTSILRFIEKRWGLEPLGPRDAAVNDLGNAFDFGTGEMPAMPRRSSY